MADKPTNTSNGLHPPGPLAPAGYIEEMERQGQRELVEGKSLPSRGKDDPAIVAMGIWCGPTYRDDPLFCFAVLPDGWKVVPRESHELWSYVVDAAGTNRVEIFYKAAYYDRRAFMRPIVGQPAQEEVGK